MEIDGKSPLVDLSSRLNRLEIHEQQAQRFHRARQESVGADADRVEISVRSREFQHLDELIQSIPDVREAKIEQIRQAIQAGTYNVRAEEVAGKILGGMLIDEIF